MQRMVFLGLSGLALQVAIACSSSDKAKSGNGDPSAQTGGAGGASGTASATQWSDNADDVQDLSPWGQAGPGIGAPSPESYLGTNPKYDPGCYRYYSSDGTGNGTSADAPAGNAIAAINAICASQTESANAKGKRLCLERGGEYRGTPSVLSHTLLQLSGCDGVSIEDFGDQRLARPKIMGSRQVTSTWTPTSADQRIYRLDLKGITGAGNTWQHNGQSYTDEERADQVFFDGKKMLLARHPNFGQGSASPTVDPRRDPTIKSMLVIDDNFPSRNAFRDAELPTQSILQSPVDWTGAHLHYKHATWISDGTVVTAYDAATHELTTRTLVATADEVQKGYFINNHIAALDAPGEWYHDAKVNALYFWAPGDVDPNAHRVDISFARYNTPDDAWNTTPVERRGYNAFRLQYSKGVTLRNLEIRHFSGDGISVGAPGATIKDCYFEGIGETGVDVGYNVDEAVAQGLGTSPVRIENTRFENTACNGILVDQPDAIAINNTLLNIGSLEQYGPNGQGLDSAGCDLTYHETGFGIKLGLSPRQTAKHNFLERIGHNGVGFHGANAVVEGNVIHLASVTKGDSGGVKCWAWDETVSTEANFGRPGVTGSIVRDNIVVETVGTAEGVYYPGTALGNGFFIDFGCQGTTFTHNTAARNTTQGMLFTIDRNQTVTGNTIFDSSMSGGAQLQLGDCELSTCPYSAHDNVLVPTIALEQSMAVANVVTLDADGNSYLDPFAVAAAPFDFNPWDGANCSLTRYSSDNATCHTLSSWRTAGSAEPASTEASFFWRDEYPSDYLSDDLIPDPGFDAATTGWEGYLGTTTAESQTTLGPSLRLDHTGGTASFQHAFSAVKDVKYEIRLRTLGVNPIEPRLLVEPMFPVEPIPTGLESFRLTRTPQESAVFIKASATEAEGYLRLTTAATRLWIDDVHVRQVETYRVPRGVVLRPGDHIPKAARAALFVNPSAQAQTVPMYDDAMLDIKGQAVVGSFELAALSSRVLIAASKLGLGKDARDLGPVAVGSSVRQRPALASIGSRPLTITSARIKESGSPFTVSAGCNQKSLDPSAVCALELTFAPTAAGTFTATLVVTTNDGQGTERAVTLRGRAQ